MFYVMPLIGHFRPLAWLLLILGFWLVAYVFNKFLARSLRNGPKYWRRSRSNVAIKRGGAFNRGSPGVSAAYSSLLSACMGDRAKVERLIQYELSRNRSLSRSQAVDSALASLRYDRSR